MNDILFKPYSLEKLRQTLVRWLPVSELTNEAEVTAQKVAKEQESLWLSLFGTETLGKVRISHQT